MDDPHRQPKDADRNPLSDRIRRAAEEGRIGAADRDIRLGNVRSAQSMAELDLIGRDLDLLEQTLAPGASAPADVVAGVAPGAGAASPVAPTAMLADQARTAAKRVGLVFVLIAVLALGTAGAVAFFVIGGSGDVDQSGELFPPLESGEPDPTGTGAPTDPGGEDTGAEELLDDTDAPSTPYALTGPGIRAYLAAYRAKFGTSRAVSLTLYGDYAIAQVPLPGGKHRHRGWLYREGQGWSEFGGASADFPGTEPVNLDALDVAALLRNIGRAKRVLNVEDISMTYVNIDYRPSSDEAENVNIYVTNGFQESGYLATRFDGTVERAYPFAR